MTKQIFRSDLHTPIKIIFKEHPVGSPDCSYSLPDRIVPGGIFSSSCPASLPALSSRRYRNLSRFGPIGTLSAPDQNKDCRHLTIALTFWSLVSGLPGQPRYPRGDPFPATSQNRPRAIASLIFLPVRQRQAK